MEKLNSVFMENLRYYLDLRKKSQIDLARAVDVSSSTVSSKHGATIPIKLCGINTASCSAPLASFRRQIAP